VSAKTERQLLAERLRATREAKKLKQADWCRLVGIEPQAWSNYEMRCAEFPLIKPSRSVWLLEFRSIGSTAAICPDHRLARDGTAGKDREEK
jgi:hypothetical protein